MKRVNQNNQNQNSQTNFSQTIDNPHHTASAFTTKNNYRMKYNQTYTAGENSNNEQRNRNVSSNTHTNLLRNNKNLVH